MRHLGPPQLPNPKGKARKSIIARSRRVARDYVALLESGILDDFAYFAARDWYVLALQGIKAKHGDWRLMCGLMAATSPQTDVRMNVILANEARRSHELDMMDQWRPFLPCHEANVHRAIAFEPLSGQKVENFRLALLGQQAIVIDTWMLRAAGFCKTLGEHPTRHEIRICYEAVKLVSKSLGLKVQEVQALVWTIYRNTNWIARRAVGTGALEA